MLEQIGSYEAKSKLPEILRRVESGEAFTITNRGKPVADIIPSKVADNIKTKSAIANIMKAKKHQVSDDSLEKHREVGRK